jgi:hypothetical protein
MRPHGPGRASNDRGSLTLSYVIVVPLVFAALLVMIQAACYGLVIQVALASAWHGADAARVLGAPRGAAAAAAVRFADSSAAGLFRNPRATESVTGHTVQVTVHGEVWSVIPGLALPVSQTVQAPVERFTTP